MTVLRIFAIAFAALSATPAAAAEVTNDMVWVALASAHIETKPGAQWQLLDRRVGKYVDFTLARVKVDARGKHVTIEIDVR
jgi:hypothetical protein